MSLSRDERVRYARHILLTEIGEEGQARLSQSSVALSQASSTAELYLERAGVRVTSPAPVTQEVLDAASVNAERVLAASVDALLGSVAAVEGIKKVLGVGMPLRAPLPRLDSSETG